MDFLPAQPLPPSSLPLRGLNTHVATGLSAMQDEAQASLAAFAPGSAVRRQASIAPIRVREPQAGPVQTWTAPGSCAQSALRALTRDDGDTTGQRLMTLHIDEADPHGRLDEFLCSFWDTRHLLFMHPHDMAARGLAEGGAVLVSAATSAPQVLQVLRLRVVPYDVPRGSVRGYARECQALVAQHASGAAGISVRVANASA